MAQRQIILRQDTSVAGQLKNMAASHQNHLARIHALWTLEGLEKLNSDLIAGALQDSHPYVRKTAIRAAESLFQNGNASDKLRNRIVQQFKKDRHPQVRIQVMLTAKLLNWDDDLNKLLNHVSNAEGLSKGVRKIANKIK
jgi:HEAT repeat protein